jgi:hypothetical protein
MSSSRQSRDRASRERNSSWVRDSFWDDSQQVPHYARYMDETADTYLVYDLRSGAQREVDKGRQSAPALSAQARRAVPGGLLLRVSLVAVALALVGGIGGLLLGIPVILIALGKRISLGGRIRRWHQRHPQQLIPAAAREEFDRVRGALWQGLLALLLGILIMYLTLPHLLTVVHLP